MFDTPLLGLNSSVYNGPTGVDEAVSATLDFGEGRRGDIHASIISPSPEDAYIYGTEGTIKIPKFWKTSSAYLIKEGQIVESIEDAKVGNGYHYEADEVMICIGDGKTSSMVMPPIESIKLATINDAMRKGGETIF